MARLLDLRFELRGRYRERRKSFRLQPDLLKCCLLVLGARAGRKARRRSPESCWTKKNTRSWKSLLRKLEGARRRARRAWVQFFGADSYAEFRQIWTLFVKWADAYLLVNPQKFLYMASGAHYRRYVTDLVQEYARKALSEKGLPVPAPPVVFRSLIRKFLTRVCRGDIPGTSMKNLLAESRKQVLVDFVSSGWASIKPKNPPNRYIKEN